MHRLAVGLAVALAMSLGASVSAQTAAKTKRTSAAPAGIAKNSRSIPVVKVFRQALVPFASAPFPYDGIVPRTGKPFFDVGEDGRRGRYVARVDGVYWEGETYVDERVLLHIPKGFNASRPSVMIVFFHGNGAILDRDVVKRQAVPRQLAESHLNAVLVAPQFAYDAWDSSAGKFWQPDAFKTFLTEAAAHLARLHGDKRTRSVFRRMPVVLIAYSGGYFPAAYVLHQGGASDRIIGVALMEALYGEHAKFLDWIEKRGTSAFFFSAYARSTTEGNMEMKRILRAHQIEPVTGTIGPLTGGRVAFVEVDPDMPHADFLTQAWAEDPLRDLLDQIPGFNRTVSLGNADRPPATGINRTPVHVSGARIRSAGSGNQ